MIRDLGTPSRRNAIVVVAIVLGAGWLAVRAAERKAGSFILWSPAFVDGGRLPAEFTCDSGRVTPPA